MWNSPEQPSSCEVEILDWNTTFHTLWDILESIDYSQLPEEVAQCIRDFEMCDESELHGVKDIDKNGKQRITIDDGDVYISMVKTKNWIDVWYGKVQKIKISTVKTTTSEIQVQTWEVLH